MNKKVDDEKQTQVKIEEINEDSITLTSVQLEKLQSKIKNVALNKA